jgi:hypothetical protein
MNFETDFFGKFDKLIKHLDLSQNQIHNNFAN